MDTHNETQRRAEQFLQLCRLSKRRCAQALGLTPTAFNDWVAGKVKSPRTTQGIAAYKHLERVLEYDSRTGGIRGAYREPQVRRFHLVQMVIAGAFE